MIKLVTALLLNIVLTVQIFSQTVPEVEWYKTFVGTGNGVDIVNDVKFDSNNNIFLAGRTAESDGYAHGLLILKYSAGGDSVLSIKYSNYASWDEANSIAINNTGDIYVAGRTSNTGLMHKYDSNGNIQWINTFQEDNSNGKFIKIATNGDPVLAYLEPYSSLNISKYYSDSGDLKWNTVVEDDTSSYDISDLIIDNTDNIYVSVNKEFECGSDVLCADASLLKLNNNGEIIWRINFESATSRIIGLDNHQNPIIITHLDDNFAKIVKLNPNSDTLWIKEFGSGITIITDLAFDSQNNILLSGYRPLEQSMAYLTTKFSSGGTEIWTQHFNSEENLRDFAHSITVDKNDNVYATGSSNISGSNGILHTIKYSKSGETEWIHSFEAPNSTSNRGTNIFVNDIEEVFIGGQVADIDDGWNFLAMKIIQKEDVSTENDQKSIPNNVHLKQNFPNPFNPTTNIQFVLPERSHVKIEIYDSMGRQVKQLTNKTFVAGNHSLEFNAENLSSGIYYYRLVASNTVITKRMALIK